MTAHAHADPAWRRVALAEELRRLEPHLTGEQLELVVAYARALPKLDSNEDLEPATLRSGSPVLEADRAGIGGEPC